MASEKERRVELHAHPTFFYLFRPQCPGFMILPLAAAWTTGARRTQLVVYYSMRVIVVVVVYRTQAPFSFLYTWLCT